MEEKRGGLEYPQNATLFWVLSSFQIQKGHGCVGPPSHASGFLGEVGRRFSRRCGPFRVSSSSWEHQQGLEELPERAVRTGSAEASSDHCCRLVTLKGPPRASAAICPCPSPQILLAHLSSFPIPSRAGKKSHRCCNEFQNFLHMEHLGSFQRG